MDVQKMEAMLAGFGATAIAVDADELVLEFALNLGDYQVAMTNIERRLNGVVGPFFFDDVVARIPWPSTDVQVAVKLRT